MPKHATKKLGLVAAGVAGLMAADAATPSQAGKIKSKDDCPQAAAINIPNLLDARKSGNESSAIGTLRPKPKGKATKKAARKKTAKKAVKRTAKKAAKKAVRKKPGRLKSALKTRKKAAKRRTARRDPC